MVAALEAFDGDAGAGLVYDAILFGGVGLLVGYRYRAPVLFLATGAALIWGTVGGWLAHQSGGQIAFRIVVLAFALHAAFLAGLALRTFANR